MTSAAPNVASIASRNAAVVRLHSILLPREHGAWGILLVPMFTGVVAAVAQGGRDLHSFMPFAAAAMAAFLLRTPIEALYGKPAPLRNAHEHNAAVYASYGYGSIAFAGALYLMSTPSAPYWLALGIVAAASIGAQEYLRARGRNTRVASQLAGSVGLTGTAAGAYVALTGRLDGTAILLWAANLLFAWNQIHFVQTRIRCAAPLSMEQRFERGKRFLKGELLLAAVLFAAAVSGVAPMLIALSFVPVLLRGAAWFLSEPRKLDVHRLGFTELGHAISFGLILAAATLLRR